MLQVLINSFIYIYKKREKYHNKFCYHLIFRVMLYSEEYLPWQKLSCVYVHDDLMEMQFKQTRLVFAFNSLMVPSQLPPHNEPVRLLLRFI